MGTRSDGGTHRSATTRRFQFPDRENGGLTPTSFDLPFEDGERTNGELLPLKRWSRKFSSPSKSMRP